MKTPGRQLTAGLALLCLLLPATVLADFRAEVDRREVRLGDSLQLTLSSDGSTNPAETDLSPLARDFEILQQSSRSSTQIVNGQTTRQTSLVVELVPRRTGDLEIPVLFAGKERTQAIALKVSEAPDSPAGDEQVVFSASVDSEAVYVQQQVILTLTLQQSIALDDRSVSELKLEKAYVKPLGQNSYQRTIDGRTWLVHEIRYAIFPEQSGSLTIPAQTFAGRARQGSRSLFSLDSGPRIRRDSDEIQIQVKPRPASFSGTAWLPARSLTLEESWSREPDELTTGDSVTRTVTVSGSGLQGAQLPPLEFPDTPGLKHYPDKPNIEEADADTGVVGLRTDSAAMVPVRPGVYLIPEVRIPWWDIEQDRLRYAVLPEREITVRPAAGTADAGTTDGALSEGDGSTAGAGAGQTPAAGDAERWVWISGLLAGAWLLTLGALIWVLRRPQQGTETGAAPPANQHGEADAWKELQTACSAGEPGPAREALRRWLRTLPEPACAQSLTSFAASQQDGELSRSLAALDAALYGPADKARNWDSQALLAAAQAARRRALDAGGGGSGQTQALPPLYPQQ